MNRTSQTTADGKQKKRQRQRKRGGASVGTQEQKVTQSKTGLMTDLYYNLPSTCKIYLKDQLR